MKKLFTLTLAILTTSTVITAQEHVYPKKGRFNIHAAYDASLFNSVSIEQEKRRTGNKEYTWRGFDGFNIGAGYTHPLWKGLGFETGLDFDFSTRKDDYEKKIYIKYTFFDVRIPLTLLYDVWCNDIFTFTPFAGFDIGSGLIGKMDIVGDATIEEKDIHIDEHMSMYSKNDMSGNPYARFIFNWHAGIRFTFCNHFSIGYTYMGPIAKMGYSATRYPDRRDEYSTSRQSHFATFTYFF